MCALTTGLNQPGSRFRWRQYIPFLNRAGIDSVELYGRWGAYPPRSTAARPFWFLASTLAAANRVRSANRYQLRFLQREMISTFCTAETLLKHPFVFDIDDAVFLNQRLSGIDRIAERADLVICGNEFLAEHFSRFAKTVILPTAVDTQRFRPGSVPSQKRSIGWSGSSSGLHYVYSIEAALNTVLERFPDVTLKIVSDRPPAFSMIDGSRVEFQQWHPDTEVAALQDLSVGIMPLADGAWERGKCSFKMLTYMAVAVPVVVSAVGMNTEVLRLGRAGIAVKSIDGWVEALSVILRDDAASAEMGRVGRSTVEAHYATSIIGPRLAEILKQTITG